MRWKEKKIPGRGARQMEMVKVMGRLREESTSTEPAAELSADRARDKKKTKKIKSNI